MLVRIELTLDREVLPTYVAWVVAYEPGETEPNYIACGVSHDAASIAVGRALAAYRIERAGWRGVAWAERVVRDACDRGRTP